MNTGRSLKGHKRILLALTAVTVAHRSPEGGWALRCLCGWASDETFPQTAAAQRAYRSHIDAVVAVALIRCRRCGVEKSRAEMRPDYRYVCRKCFSKMGNEWQRRHPMQTARHRRNHHLLKKYGITLAEAEALLASQGGVCAICQKPITDTRDYGPHVDHDHETGRVRGILCLGCNTGLGGFRDDPKRMLAAIAYLGALRG